MMEDAVNAAYGLRLLKQEPFETLISFIISANNNIPRIRGTLEKLCRPHFPNAEEMARLPVDFYKGIGCGYRAEYLVKTAQAAREFDFEALRALETGALLERLQKFHGVGPKVADCIALFAYGRHDVFPVDTWVKKIYRDIFKKDGTPKRIREDLINLYGESAGLAQQYLFYNKRSLS
jgi:N-glycosylase/DNA lyase